MSLIFLSSRIISPLMEKSLGASVFDKGAHRYPASLGLVGARNPLT